MSQLRVEELIHQGTSLSCANAAQVFMSLAAQPSERFQLALKSVLPVLQDASGRKASERILAAFILFALYSPHPIAINPFKSALCAAFTAEKRAYTVSSSSSAAGHASGSQQLVWVIWKILRGEGGNLESCTPSTLAAAKAPPVLSPEQLQISEDTDGVTATCLGLSSHDGSSINSPPSLDQTFTQSRIRPAADLDTRTETSCQLVRLLQASLNRTLTLSEQRYLTPILQRFISTISIVSSSPDALSQYKPVLDALRVITSLDIASLALHNPSVAHLVVVALLLAASSQDQSFPVDSLEPAAMSRSHTFIAMQPSAIKDHLSALANLPPTLQSFDLLGRLLAESTPVQDLSPPLNETIAPATIRVAELVKSEVLGRFLTQCTGWLDAAAAEEDVGFTSDDRVAQGVRNLCRFYMSLVAREMIDARFDPTAPLMEEFALHHARFDDAIALYRTLAAISP